MSYEERRRKVSLKEVIVAKKEISVGWLTTFLCGGVVNFAIIIWTAAIVYNRVDGNTQDIVLIKTHQEAIIDLVSKNITELKRQAEVDSAYGQRLLSNEAKIQSLDQRIYDLKKQGH